MSFNNSGIVDDWASVTPHATNQNHFTGLYVGGAGNVEVVTAKGTTVVFSGVPAGAFLPIAVSKVLAANTTATLILGAKP